LEKLSRVVKLPYHRPVFVLNQPVFLDYCFDFIDVDPLLTDPTLDLTKVYVMISGDSYKWRLSDLVGSYVKACGISISFEDSEKGKTLGLILGGEYQQYQRLRAYTIITQETIGLIRNLQTIDSDIKTLDSDFKNITTEIRTFKFLNVNVGTAQTPITSTSTLAVMLLIQNNSTVDVYLGDASSQPIKIPAGGSFSIVMPLGKQFDLSKLYLSASTNTNVVVMYS